MRTILIAAALLIYAAPAICSDRTIRVAGDGKATAAPDMATIHAGVSSRAATAAEALAANNKAMAAVLATLKDQGIAPKDLQTSNLGIHPVYRTDNQGRTVNEIIAYEVSNQVRVHVRDLAKFGGVLDAVVKSGANQMSGVNFGFADNASIQDKARAAAIDDAKRRAQIYAKQAGVKLGKVLTISEQPIQRPQYEKAGIMLGRAMESGVPIATGEEEIQVQVFVEYALED